MKWESRAAIYKFSLICADFVFLIYALAFSLPLWLGYDPTSGDSLIMGLWAGGKGDQGNIDDIEATGFGEGTFGIDNEPIPDWLEAVRGLWLGGMTFYLVGVIFSFVENCCMGYDTKDYGISGFLILLAGLCGAAGVITTAVEVEEDSADLDYLWGYILAVIASGLSIIFAIVLLISKNYGDYDNHIKNSRTADYVYTHNKHNQRPYSPEYNNPGYRDELPLVNGAPFHQPHSHSPYNMYRSGQENGFSGPKYDQGPGYNPYGYTPQAGNRTSVADSADLSNGYTPDIIHAENSLGRPRPDYSGGRSQSQYSRGDYFYNGNGNRPY